MPNNLNAKDLILLTMYNYNVHLYERYLNLVADLPLRMFLLRSSHVKKDREGIALIFLEVKKRGYTSISELHDNAEAMYYGRYRTLQEYKASLNA